MLRCFSACIAPLRRRFGRRSYPRSWSSMTHRPPQGALWRTGTHSCLAARDPPQILRLYNWLCKVYVQVAPFERSHVSLNQHKIEIGWSHSRWSAHWLLRTALLSKSWSFQLSVSSADGPFACCQVRWTYCRPWAPPCEVWGSILKFWFTEAPSTLQLFVSCWQEQPASQEPVADQRQFWLCQEGFSVLRPRLV